MKSKQLKGQKVYRLTDYRPFEILDIFVKDRIPYFVLGQITQDDDFDNVNTVVDNVNLFNEYTPSKNIVKILKNLEFVPKKKEKYDLIRISNIHKTRMRFANSYWLKLNFFRDDKVVETTECLWETFHYFVDFNFIK